MTPQPHLKNKSMTPSAPSVSFNGPFPYWILFIYSKKGVTLLQRKVPTNSYKNAILPQTSLDIDCTFLYSDQILHLYCIVCISDHTDF